eukprot:TRINITY_DN4332_c0_g1_i1.p1 TRINITY_DN4332_c0_g1~~TRINITY_DN4332_c0_g1_i1.p1  ORF type:complete len:121 (-),score=16.31 TRINITY_DN4332_c0_g1_i1:60-422(-)
MGKGKGKQGQQNHRQNKNAEHQTRMQMRKERQKNQYGDAQWKSDWNKFLVQLEAIGLTIKDVAGDGNCLFRAMADQMTGDPSLHSSYRSGVCDFLAKNRQDYEPFIEDDESFDSVRNKRE